MEISQKYDQAMIDHLAEQSGFRVGKEFQDSRGWFTDQLWLPAEIDPDQQRAR